MMFISLSAPIDLSAHGTPQKVQRTSFRVRASLVSTRKETSIRCKRTPQTDSSTKSVFTVDLHTDTFVSDLH